MSRKVVYLCAGTVLALGLAGAAYAQQQQAGTGNASQNTGFNYEIRGGERVEKPDSRTVAADGTVREEFRSGKCVTIKEKRPDGAIKTTRKCD